MHALSHSPTRALSLNLRSRHSSSRLWFDSAWLDSARLVLSRLGSALLLFICVHKQTAQLTGSAARENERERVLCKENDSAVASGCFLFFFLSRRFCYYASSAYYTSPLLPPFASHSLSRSPQLRLAAEAAAAAARRRRSRQLSVFRSRNVNCASLPAVAARRRCLCPLSLSRCPTLSHLFIVTYGAF